MKKFFVILAAAAMAINVSAQKTITLTKEISGADEIITNFWDNTNAPHSNFETRDEKINNSMHFSQTSQTDFYIYKADPAKATGQGIVVLPGGGYSKVCIAHEGFAIAQYFQSIGISAVVVKYRLPNHGNKIVPLEDAQAALNYMRTEGKKWGVDPNQVGICGSSAGGHLAAYTSNFTADAEKPAFSILFYPVITGTTWATQLRILKTCSILTRLRAATSRTFILLTTHGICLTTTNRCTRPISVSVAVAIVSSTILHWAT